MNTDLTPAPAAPRRTGLVIALTAVAILAVLAAGAAAFFGLRSDGKPSAPAALAAPPASSTPASPTPLPSPTQSPTPAAHKFGQSVPLGTLATATVYAFKQPVASGATRPDQAGYTWGAADIKVCAGSGAGESGQGISVTHAPWSLVYADATVIQPSSIGYQQFPQPEYPWDDRNLTWGRCVRGWVTFAVPANARPVMVEYQPQTEQTSGQVIDWSL